MHTHNLAHAQPNCNPRNTQLQPQNLKGQRCETQGPKPQVKDAFPLFHTPSSMGAGNLL
jgi:hypothetical protein